MTIEIYDTSDGRLARYESQTAPRTGDRVKIDGRTYTVIESLFVISNGAQEAVLTVNKPSGEPPTGRL